MTPSAPMAGELVTSFQRPGVIGIRRTLPPPQKSKPGATGRGSRHEAGACRAARGAHHCPMEAALHDDRRRERPRRGREIFLARLTLLQGREGDRIDPGATAADPLETTITS